MLTTDALKKLYVAMGGTASDVENLTLTPELIAAIAEIYSGGGSSLPAVTSDDNGKALLVQEGAWDKGTLPSGLPEVSASDNNKSLRVASGEWAVDANQFAVHFTNGGGAWSADKTFAEVSAALNAGKDVVGIVEGLTFGSTTATAIGKLSVFKANGFATFAGSAIQEVAEDTYKLLTVSVALLANEVVRFIIGLSDITVS